MDKIVVWFLVNQRELNCQYSGDDEAWGWKENVCQNEKSLIKKYNCTSTYKCNSGKRELYLRLFICIHSITCGATIDFAVSAIFARFLAASASERRRRTDFYTMLQKKKKNITEQHLLKHLII